MSIIAPQERQKVESAKRGYLTKAQKIARWEELGRCCTRCGLLCEPFGPTVIWDHFKGVWFGQTSRPEDFEPNHNTPECAGAKTSADATGRAKTKRLIRKATTPQKPSRLKGRGFSKTRKRLFSGKVVER